MSRWTKQQLADVQKRLPDRASKYGNRKKEIGGRVFDSTKEARRYQELLLLKDQGEITDLKCQQKIACVVNLQHVCNYVADFVYQEAGARVVEDCKGFRTEIYRLKRKLVSACHGITIRES